MKQVYKNSIVWRTMFFAIVMMLTTVMVDAQFTAGRLVILRNGATGQASAPTSSGTALFLDEYSVAGSAGISVALPTTTSGSVSRVVGSGSATSEGQLNLSSDGSILLVGGYDAALGTASVGSAAGVARVIARVDNSANVSTTVLTVSDGTAANNSYAANNFRAITATDGSRYWTGGNGTSSTGGIRTIAYSGSSSTPAIASQVSSTTSNIRIPKIFNGQLYYSTSSGIFKVGTGLPTSSGTTSTALFTMQTANSSSYSFIFLDRDATVAGPDVMYVADDGTGTGGTRSIFKYSFDGSTWTSRGSVTNATGMFGLTGIVSGGNAILYATTTTSVVTITDAAAFNANMTGTYSTIITAPTNTFFRGIAFAPSSSCASPAISSVTSNSPICSTATLNLNVSATGTAPLTYSWSGTGSFSSTSVSNPTVTGAASGTYTVTVTNVCGSSTSSTTVGVNTPVVPSVSTAANPGNTICAGINTIFSATPVNGGALPSYQWYLNSNPVGTNSATYSNSTLANGDQVYVDMTSNASCISTTTGTSNTITMNVNASVLPTISISPAPSSSICSGTNVTFTASVTNEGITPSYQWYVNSLPVGTNSNIYSSASLANGDVVTCELTSNATCAVPSTVLSSSVTMTVASPSVPTISISVLPSSTICSGSNATFTATITNGGGSPLYQWLVNSLPVGTNSSTYSSTALSNGDVVECTLTSSAACITVSTANSNQITMAVGTSIVPSITIAESSNSICDGANVTFAASILFGGSSPSYQWQVNSIDAGTNSSSFSSSTLANGDIVTCILMSNDPCASPLIVTSNTVTMIVNPVAVPSVTISANPGISICANTAVTFTATPVNGGATPSYVWKLNGNIVGSNSDVYSNLALLNGDIISVELTSNEVCATPTTASNSVTMTVFSAPVVNISPAIYTLLTGRSVTLTASGAVGYSWSPNTSTAAAASVNPTISTIYTVVGTDANGCTATSTSNVTVINSYTAGNIIIQRVGNGTSLTSGSTANFLDEYNSLTGGLVKTTTVPITGSNRLTTSGSATSEAQMTRASDKSKLVVTGYDATTGVSSINGSSATAVNRIAESCDYAQTISRAAATTSFSANNIRSGTSDGTNYWSAGANTGTVLMTTGAGVIVQSVIVNTRVTKIYNGQLYFSTGSATIGIYAIGSGSPISAGNSNTLVVATGVGSSPYSFAFNSTTTVCYVADDRASTSGGVQKYTYNGSVWSLAYTLGTGVANIGARGLEVDFSGTDPIVYATTGEASSNRLIKIVDTGASSTATTLATAPLNTAFRGLAFAPECAPAAKPVITVSSVQNSCSAATSGAIDITVSNGNAPYTYSWSNGATIEDISSLLPNTYSVTVMDNSGCSSVLPVTVQPVTSPAVTIAGNNQFCPSGSTTLDAGSGYTTYLWSPNGETTQTISVSTAGTYSVAVTNAAGCSSSGSLNVTQASNPTVSIIGNLNICTGGTTVLDAGAGYSSYLWSESSQTTQTISVSSAGTYSVTVTNAAGCSASTSVIVNETPGITPVITGSNSLCTGSTITISTDAGYDSYLWSPNGETTNSITVSAGGTYSVSVTSGTCSGTSSAFTVTQNSLPTVSISPLDPTTCANTPLTLTASGADTYSWTPSTGLNVTTGEEVIATLNSTTTYTVTGTDVNGCSNTATSTITINASPIVTVDHSQVGICSGESVTIIASGATSYTWIPSSGLDVTSGATVIATPSSNTIYTVVGSNGSGCSASATVNVVVVTPLSAPVVNSPVTYCLNAVATPLTAIPASNSSLLWYSTLTGGSGSTIAPTPVTGVAGTTTYYVSSAPASTVNIAINGMIDNGSPDVFRFVALSDIVAGTKIYFTDNGWTGVAFRGANTTNYVGNEGLVRFTAINPIVSGTVITSVDTLNSNFTWTSTGVIDPANPSFGSYAPIAFSTSGDQVYAFLSSNPVNPINNISRHLFVFDNTGGFEPATSSSQGAIPSGLSALDGTAITMTNVNNYIALINDGQIRTAPMWYAYMTDTANNYTKISNFNNLLPPFSLTPYNVASACESPRASIEVNVLDAPDPGAASNSPVCSGSDINLFSDPFSFFIGWSWTGPNTFSSADQNPIITGVTAANSGDYTVTVTDFNGCSASQTINVFVSNITINGSIINTNCSGGNSGAIDITVTNGVAPYTYAWSNSETTEDISGLGAGNYTVVVTDANGCTSSATFTVVSQNTSSSLTVTATPAAICLGSSSTLDVTGGNTYTWSPSTGLNSTTGASVIATPLSTITYTVTSVDLGGCPSVGTVTVTVNGLPTVSALPLSTTICEGSSQTLTASGTVSYSWTPSASLNNATGASVIASPFTNTIYTVVGTDINGCTASASATVNVINTPSPTVSSPVTYCQNATAAQLTATATPGYTLHWYTTSVGGTSTSVAPTPSTTTPGTTPYYVSQTAITPLAIAITGWFDGGSPDVFAFNALSDISAGTVIYFTDNGWITGTGFRGATATNGGGNEGICKWTAVSNIPAGTIILSNATSANFNWATSGTIPGTTSSYSAIALSNSGDQIYAFTSTATTNPLFNIANMTHLYVFDDTNGFETSTTSATGAVPPGLTSGVNANSFNFAVNSFLGLINDGQTRTISNWYSYISTPANYQFTVLPSANLNIDLGCESPRVPINVIVNANPTVSATAGTILCNGGTTSVNVTATDGTSPYNGTGSFTVSAGTYNYNVSDANGCLGTASATVTEPALLSASAIETNPVACPGGTATVTVSATGGTAPFSGTGSFNPTAGTYTYTVTDANGCSTTTNITLADPTSIAISSVTPSIGCPGDVVVILGSNFNLSTAVEFNGTPATTYTVDNAGQITVTIPTGATTGSLTVAFSPSSCLNASIPFTILCNSGITLTTTAFIEGYSIGSANYGSTGGLMDNGGLGGLLYFMGMSADPFDVDDMQVSLMDPTTFAEVATAIGVLKTDGTIIVSFPSMNSGSYYIKLNQRNSIETWSAAPVSMGSVASYNFSTSASQAYGDNMTEVYPGVWAIYSGDISDANNLGLGYGYQDGIIESQDYSDMELSNYFNDAGYVPGDLTGDGIVESSDYQIMEGNNYFNRALVRPF